MVLCISVFTAFYLVAQSNANPIRVACVGDSITLGTAYPEQLAGALGSNYSVRNFGVGKATVLFNSDKPYTNQSAFPEAKKFLPNIVVIMLGTNDAYPIYEQYTANFIGDYTMLIGEFQALSSKPKILIVLPPPIFNDSLGPSNTNLKNDIIPRIEQVGQSLDLQTVDIYSALINHPEFFPDGVHPNNEGSQLIALKIYDAIKSYS